MRARLIAESERRILRFSVLLRALVLSVLPSAPSPAAKTTTNQEELDKLMLEVLNEGGADAADAASTPKRSAAPANADTGTGRVLTNQEELDKLLAEMADNA